MILFKKKKKEQSFLETKPRIMSTVSPPNKSLDVVRRWNRIYNKAYIRSRDELNAFNRVISKYPENF